MAKIRGVKPDFWTDDEVVELSPLARLLYIGLWNYACDNGHLEDKPRQIKLRVLPGDDCSVTALLDELAGSGRIERAGGWVTVPNLGQHQRIDRRYFTTCDKPGCDEPETTSSQRESRRGNDGSTTGARRANTVSTSGARVDGDGDGEGEGDSDLSISDRFAEFWSDYPRKIGRGQAVKAWKAAVKKSDADTILSGLKRQLPSMATADPKFIPHPTTWLNGERWADEATVKPQVVDRRPEGWR